MGSGFVFGFGGEDIQDPPEEELQTQNSFQEEDKGLKIDNNRTGRPARSHNLQEILESLPSQVTYTSLDFTDAYGNPCSVPKRDYADIRVQMMAEDEGEYSAYLSGSDDIKENEYEGGFKTWECAIDLADMALHTCSAGSKGARYRNITELGCGSAIPSLVLFQYALKHKTPTILTLADYNEEVLRLLTVPNLLLNWAKASGNPSEAPLRSQNSNLSSDVQEQCKRTDTNSISNNNNKLLSSPSGHFQITPQIIAAFLSDLEKSDIKTNLISGSWDPAENFISLAYPYTSFTSSHPSHPTSSLQTSPAASTDAQAKPAKQHADTLILSAETIYSLTSLNPFVNVLEGLLRQHRDQDQDRHQHQQQNHREDDVKNLVTNEPSASLVNATGDLSMRDAEDASHGEINGKVDGTVDKEHDNITATATARGNRTPVGTSKALIAAKRIYFGVGGSVDAFIEAAGRKGLVAKELAPVDRGADAGQGSEEGFKGGSVSRCIVEVRLPE